MQAHQPVVLNAPLKNLKHLLLLSLKPRAPVSFSLMECRMHRINQILFSRCKL
uniref:Alternative protein SP4 n=1 Tax=Homo sapiens TaxID=9606 RepID=L0R552_HUMAN|nr:alternative protein SP4 [Homo sapiens]